MRPDRVTSWAGLPPGTGGLHRDSSDSDDRPRREPEPGVAARGRGPADPCGPTVAGGPPPGGTEPAARDRRSVGPERPGRLPATARPGEPGERRPPRPRL